MPYFVRTLLLLSFLFACSSPEPRRQHLVICGQSNAVGTGRITELMGDALLIADPYPAVQYATNVGGDGDPPDTVVFANDDLGPRLYRDGDVPAFGVELSLGRDLDAAMPGRWSISKFARGSTALTIEWDPSGPYPMSMPLNLFEQFEEDIQFQLDANGNPDLAAFVWIQGEGDAPAVSAAKNYGRRLRVFVDLLHLRWPDVPFFYGRLAIGTTYIGRDDLRASQEAVQSDLMIMVDQDGIPLRTDNTHFNAQGLIDLGHRYAGAVLEKVQK